MKVWEPGELVTLNLGVKSSLPMRVWMHHRINLLVIHPDIPNTLMSGTRLLVRKYFLATVSNCGNLLKINLLRGMLKDYPGGEKQTPGVKMVYMIRCL